MRDYTEYKTLEIELDSQAANETLRVSYLFGLEGGEPQSWDVPGCLPSPYVDQPVYQGVYDQDGQRIVLTELQEQAYATFGIAHFRANEVALAERCYKEFTDPINRGYRDLMRALHGPSLERDADEFNRIMAGHHEPACAG